MTSGQEAGNAPPWRWLAGLTLAVLALHLVLLQARPGAFSIGMPATTRALITRSVTPQPPPPPSEAAPAQRTAAASPRAPEDNPPEAAPRPKSAPNPPQPLVESMQVATETIAIAATPPDTVIKEPAAALPAAAQSPSALPSSNALSIPSTVVLRYTIDGESRTRRYQADAALRWRQNGVEYEATMEIATLLLGSRQQSSVGRITSEGLAPTRFAEKSRSEQAAHFEWAKGKVIFSNNAPEAALMAGMQDRLSVFLQLGAMLGGEPERYPPSTTIVLQTVGTREADPWTFTVIGPETLQLPGGELATIKLERQQRHQFDQKVEVWLAPKLDYLPARLRLTQANGDVVDQQWQKTLAD